jgi:hypothetical protein
MLQCITSIQFNNPYQNLLRHVVPVFVRLSTCFHDFIFTLAYYLLEEYLDLLCPIMHTVSYFVAGIIQSLAYTGRSSQPQHFHLLCVVIHPVSYRAKDHLRVFCNKLRVNN